MDTGATRAAPDEDALLREALAFIGDLDFDVDATVDEADELASLLQEEPSDAVPPPVVDTMAYVLPMNIASPGVPVCTNQQLQVEAATPKTEAAATATLLVPPAWPDVTDAKPKTENRTRNRRREELLYLRDLVGNLEQRLTSLRSVPASESSPGASEEPNELVAAWEQVATRQYKQREQAEMENIKLRRLLQDQIQVGKSLERLLLRKRPNLEALESGIAVEKRLRRSNSYSWDKASIFDELLTDCAAQYADTARILARFDAIPPAKPHRDVQLIHDADLGMIVQTTEHRVLPFSYEDTANVIWNSFPEASTVHRFHEYHDVNLTEDTMKLQFRVTSDINRANADFAVKLATRRYFEANRIVIVVSALFDPNEVFQTSMKGVCMRHAGWHIIERMPMDGKSSRIGTKLRSYHRSVPEVDEDLVDQTRKVGTLTNFLFSAISVEMESRNQNLDNRLLELSLNGRNGAA